MICAHCEEPILPGEDRADLINVDAHRECALRVVLGGIGHLIDHEHFCGSELGPDAGLDYRTSSLMVDVWAHRVGLKLGTQIGWELMIRDYRETL
jgi:hypothetical protein